MNATKVRYGLLMAVLSAAAAAPAQMGIGNWRIEQSAGLGLETCTSWVEGTSGPHAVVVALPHDPMPTAAVNLTDTECTPQWQLTRSRRTVLTWTGMGPPPPVVRIMERSKVTSLGTGDGEVRLEADNGLGSPLRVLDPGEVPSGFREGVVSEGVRLRTLPVAADGTAELVSQISGAAVVRGLREAAAKVEWSVSVQLDDRELAVGRTDGGRETRVGDRVDTDTLRSWVGIDDLGFIYDPPGPNPLFTQSEHSGPWHQTLVVRPDLSIWRGPNIRTTFSGSMQTGPQAVSPAFELVDLIYGDLMPLGGGEHRFDVWAEDLEDHAQRHLDYRMHLHHIHEDYRKVTTLPPVFRRVKRVWSGYLAGNDSYSVEITYKGGVATRTAYSLNGEAVFGIGKWHIQSATISAEYQREKTWTLDESFSLTVNVTATYGPGLYELWFGVWQDAESGLTNVYNRLGKQQEDAVTQFSPSSSARLGHNIEFRRTG